MIPEIGHFALVLALCVAIVQGVVPLLGAWRKVPEWCALATHATLLQGALVLTAFAALTASFLMQDFSVAYVAENSNRALPIYYRFSAVWGAHEGSLLLWALILNAWSVAVALRSRALPPEFRARVLAVMGLISIGFLLFMLTTSDPFQRLLPAPPDGHDLNPILQDPGLIAHPPTLYMGYVGLSVPFAFAIAALLGGRIDAVWTRWTRPWTLVSWLFLTCGITAGSWWSYYELGWGGWWFWDPVENASFMPWLVATALIHSLAVTEQRGAFRAWTVLLAIFAFTLSLLGTFLVRSGVLVSVHAFASDPARGVFILGFLGVVVGAALILYALRAHRVTGGGSFELLSRETLLLVNNVVLVVASASILLGTLYPLICDALGLGKISVGPPYFDRVFGPLMVPALLLMGVAPLTRWKRDDWRALLRRLRPALIVAAVLGAGAAATAVAAGTVIGAAGAVFAVWVIASTGLSLRNRLRQGRRLPRAFLGMSLAHLGFAVATIGITVASGLSVERDVRLAPGGTHSLAGYQFRFDGVTERQGPNYRAEHGTITVLRDGQKVAVLHPEKRTYDGGGQPMTEAAINGGLTRDVYVALGEPLGDGSWSVRLYDKPFVRWIWAGGFLMALGGILAASDRRYRLKRSRRAVQERSEADAESDAMPAGATAT